jgi:hypothetical protein
MSQLWHCFWLCWYGISGGWDSICGVSVSNTYFCEFLKPNSHNLRYGCFWVNLGSSKGNEKKPEAKSLVLLSL